MEEPFHPQVLFINLVVEHRIGMRAVYCFLLKAAFLYGVRLLLHKQVRRHIFHSTFYHDGPFSSSAAAAESLGVDCHLSLSSTGTFPSRSPQL